MISSTGVTVAGVATNSRQKGFREAGMAGHEVGIRRNRLRKEALLFKMFLKGCDSLFIF